MDNEINTQSAMNARASVDNAKRYARDLQSVISYLRNDHVGMLRGDGEMTRYLNFLASQAVQQITQAEAHLKHANVPDPLPF